MPEQSRKSSKSINAALRSSGLAQLLAQTFTAFHILNRTHQVGRAVVLGVFPQSTVVVEVVVSPEVAVLRNAIHHPSRVRAHLQAIVEDQLVLLAWDTRPKPTCPHHYHPEIVPLASP